MEQDNPIGAASGAVAESAPASRPHQSVGLRTHGYLRLMFALLMSVTVFEGYDVTIFHLCTPDIARSFHLDDLAVGAMASFVRLGGALAFFIVMIADQKGRKPVVATTVLLYTLSTLATALSRGLASFTVFQSCSQVFLSAEFGVATIMISEEFPDRWRGTGVALLNLVGLLGVVAAGTLYGRIADSRWGWRGMYLLGVAPLLLVAFLRRNLRETVRFESLKVERELGRSAAVGFGQRIWQAIGSLGGPYRGRLLLVALLWNSVGLVGAPAVTFFSLYAKRDHHWTSSEIGRAVVIAYTIGTMGHLLAGYMLDRVGRKATTAGFYVAGALSILALFQTASHQAMLTSMVITVFAFQGARTATATYSAELFPTKIRATSYSLTVQVLGQITALLTPFTIGFLSRYLAGLGNAVAAVSVGPVLGAILVLFLAPETRGKKLEELAMLLPE